MSPKICALCGAVNREKARYCAECGRKLSVSRGEAGPMASAAAGAKGKPGIWKWGVLATVLVAASVFYLGQRGRQSGEQPPAFAPQPALSKPNQPQPPAAAKTAEELPADTKPAPPEIMAPLAPAKAKVPAAGDPETLVELQGIITNPEGGNKAIVNGELVGEGDMAGKVRVLKITGQAVTFLYENLKFTKSVNEGDTAASSKPVPPAARVTAGKAGIEWVSIPGGSFMMGSEESPDEKPLHRVSVKAFQLAKTEVTNKQYRACVAAGACTAAHVSDGTCNVYNGSAWSQGNLPDSFQGDDQPVLCVDWEQAKTFSRWAGGRLPTEAEWEYAARSGGRDWKYPWGNENATCERAVIDDGGNGCGKNSTWPVCSKPKGNTEQGLCDMAGNAWEWTQDWYHDSYSGAPTDGSAWEIPTGSIRVFRGGSWYGDAGDARSALRGGNVTGTRYVTLGFRPAAR